MSRKFYIFLLIILVILTFGGWKTNVISKYKEKQEKIKTEKRVEGIQTKKEKNYSTDNKLLFPIATFPIAPVPFKKENAADLKLPNAHAAAILDVDSGKIIYEKNGNEKRQIASLTKVLTAIIALEKISHPEKEIITMGDEIYIEGTKVGCPRSGYCISNRLKVGEKIYAIDLLKAMLMNSANDAATAIGKHIGGSVDGFAKMMNQKVEKMGLQDSHFCTPSGLEIEGREKEAYSTAIDIARIAAFSMKYETIWSIFRIPEAEIYSVDQKQSHRIINTDRLLNEMPGCLGGKTGFTPLAGHSLMLGVQDKTGQHRIIIVVLDDPYRWSDVKKMAEWAWSNYEWK